MRPGPWNGAAGRAELYGDAEDWLSRGNTAIIGPGGDVLAGPLTGEEGIVYAEIDARVARASRQQFDPVGHYSRSDVLRLAVNATPRTAVSFHRDNAADPARRPGDPARPPAGPAPPPREMAPPRREPLPHTSRVE